MGVLPALFYLFLALAALAMAGGLLVWVIRYVGSRDGAKSEGNPESTTATALPRAGEQELLRVSRTEKGKLVILVQGQYRRHLREISDPQVGRDTTEAIKAVLAFAEGWLPASRHSSTPPAPRASAPDEEVFLERLRQSDLFSARMPARATASEPLVPVEAINDLVQQRLKERPDLAERRINMTTEADGSLRIYVGPQSFESVDEIPEPAVRALIQDAIHEWELSCPSPA